MSDLTVAAAITTLDGAQWMPPVSHWEIATTDGVWGAHAGVAADREADAYPFLRCVAETHGVELADDGRCATVDFEYDGTPFRFWWLRPVLRWIVPERCATCPTKLGQPDVKFVRLGEGDREAPVICVPCRDLMQAQWVSASPKPAAELAGLRARVAELEAAQLPAEEYGPAFPWVALMDDDDRSEFLGELAAAAINYYRPEAGDEATLAEIEKACMTWRLIAEAQHAHNTAPGPDAEADRIVAYRSRGGRLLRCLDHAPNPAGSDFLPVTSEDLPDGGICTYSECGRDVLIPVPDAGGAS